MNDPMTTIIEEAVEEVGDPSTPPETPPATPPETPPVTPPATPPAEPSPDDVIIPESFFPVAPPETPPETPPATPPGTPPETPSEITDEEIQGMEAKQREAFIRLRQENATLRQQQPSPAPTEELTALQAKLKEANTVIARLDLQQTPEFQAQFVAPKEELVAAVETTLKSLEIEDPGTVAAKLSALPAAERFKAVDELLGLKQAAVLPLFTQMDLLDSRRAAALEAHKATSDQLRQQNAAQIGQIKASMMQSSVAQLAQEGMFVFQKIEGNEQWNQVVDKMIERTGAVFRSNDPAVQAKTLTAGVAAPFLLAALKQRTTENAKLRQQLGSRIGREPGARGDQPPAPGDKLPADMTPEQAAEALIAQASSA